MQSIILLQWAVRPSSLHDRLKVRHVFIKECHLFRGQVEFRFLLAFAPCHSVFHQSWFDVNCLPSIFRGNEIWTSCLTRSTLFSFWIYYTFLKSRDHSFCFFAAKINCGGCWADGWGDLPSWLMRTPLARLFEMSWASHRFNHGWMESSTSTRCGNIGIGNLISLPIPRWHLRLGIGFRTFWTFWLWTFEHNRSLSESFFNLDFQMSCSGRRPQTGQRGKPFFLLPTAQRPNVLAKCFLTTYVFTCCSMVGLLFNINSICSKGLVEPLTDLPDLEIDESRQTRRAKHDDDTFVITKEYICSVQLRQKPLLCMLAEDVGTYPLLTDRTSKLF